MVMCSSIVVFAFKVSCRKKKMAQMRGIRKQAKSRSNASAIRKKISNGVIPIPPVNSINAVANYDVSAI